MKRITYTLIVLAALFAVYAYKNATVNYVINSPDGKIDLIVQQTDSGLFYSVNYKGKSLIQPSKLGFELKDGTIYDENINVESKKESSRNQTWEQVWGEQKFVKNNYKLMHLNLKSNNNTKLAIAFKVYNDGIGFRYEFEGENKTDSVIITDEITQFNLAENFTGWYIPANYESYEMLYNKKPASEIESANTPITFQTQEGTCLSIHEANLTNYAGMTLKKQDNNPNSFECNLVPWPDGTKVKTQGGFVSPWRTITIAENAAKLIESTLILNLNEPNKINDTQWIKPLKYVGIWWGMHLGVNTWTLDERHGATTEEMIKYMDFAKANNIKGVLAEGWNTGWEDWGKPKAFDFVTPYADFDLPKIAKYAQDNRLELMGHHETGGDSEYYEEKLDEAFSLYRSLGVKYVKTGYAGSIQSKGQFHHGQYMVNHYRKVVETAAKYQINLNVHEPIKPTGIRRTYPNMMTREGARGMEWNGWSDGNPPSHHVIVPFTRLLAGPLDYTPGVFDLLYKNAGKRVKWNGQDKGTSRINTTLAKQLALFVIFYSPMQMASDLVKNYENHDAFQFIRDVPADWETTKVLNAEIGEYVTIARKDINSDDWYIGSITNEKKRNLKIKLDFLEKGKKYIAEIYADTKKTDWKANPYPYKTDKIEVNNQSELILKLAPGGGQAIRIRLVD